MESDNLVDVQLLMHYDEIQGLHLIKVDLNCSCGQVKKTAIELMKSRSIDLEGIKVILSDLGGVVEDDSPVSDHLREPGLCILHIHLPPLLIRKHIGSEEYLVDPKTGGKRHRVTGIPEYYINKWYGLHKNVIGHLIDRNDEDERRYYRQFCEHYG